MGLHRIHLASLDPSDQGEILVEGDEAHHAIQSKRLREGEAVELLDGVGQVGSGRVVSLRRGHRKKGDRAGLVVAVEAIESRARCVPCVDVWTGVPKGDRLESMVDGLSQVGAATWTPMRTAWGAIEPRAGRLGRLHRIAAESGKQCGRAWFMEIGAQADFADGLRGSCVLIGDAAGEPLSSLGELPETVRLLIGPEGGFSPDELDAARAAGARAVRLGVHTMRIETAAVVGAAGLMG